MGNVDGSGAVGSTSSEKMGASRSRTGDSTVGHCVASGVRSLGRDIGTGGIVRGFSPVGTVVGLSVPGSTLHSGTSDSSGVRVIPVPRPSDVDGCSDGGVPTEGWVIITAGRNANGSPDGGTTSTEIEGAIAPSVFKIGYLVRAVLVGSTSCIMGNVVGSGVVGTIGAETVAVTGSRIVGSIVGHGVGSGVRSLGINTGKGGNDCGFGPVEGVVGL